ncbi:MAG: hypothetical protein ABSA04_11950 [Desulfobaccales bacterium]
MFQQSDREEERAARNKGANILRHTLSLTQLLKAGCVSLSRPTATQSLAKEMGNAQIQEEVAGSPEAGSLLAQAHQLVGRESEAHPAFSIISSLDFQRYHLPPILTLYTTQCNKYGAFLPE